MPRRHTHMFGGKLIERDPVTEAPAIGMRGAGEEAFFRRVSARDTGQAHTGKDRHFLTMLRQLLQVGRKRVITPAFLREEKLRHDAHVRFDGDHAPRHGGRLARTQHGFEKRQRERDSCTLQQRAARDGAVQIEVHKRGKLKRSITNNTVNEDWQTT